MFLDQETLKTSNCMIMQCLALPCEKLLLKFIGANLFQGFIKYIIFPAHLGLNTLL